MIAIDELLSFKYVETSEGLLEYAPCFRLNIGTGKDKQFAPLKRLRRLNNGALLQMNINKHDHQRMIMVAIRTYINEIDQKELDAIRYKEEQEMLTKRNIEEINNSLSLSVTSQSNGGSYSSSRPNSVSSPHGSRLEAEKSTSKGTRHILTLLYHKHQGFVFIGFDILILPVLILFRILYVTTPLLTCVSFYLALGQIMSQRETNDRRPDDIQVITPTHLILPLYF